MKLIKDSLTTTIERWDDPGDYPSNAGSGPMTPYDYVAEIEGSIIVELEGNETPAYINDEPGDVPHDSIYHAPDGYDAVKIKKWRIIGMDRKISGWQRNGEEMGIIDMIYTLTHLYSTPPSLSERRNVNDYFAEDGSYKGPDDDGIEPMFAGTQLTLDVDEFE